MLYVKIDENIKLLEVT